MVVHPIYESALANGWHPPQGLLAKLTAYERQFFKNEFLGKRSKDYYKARLRKIGFEGKGAVLDLACGMGQWTAAMSELNQTVLGVDLNQSRLSFAESLLSFAGATNASFRVGAMETIPAEDNSFDAIFCYGSFMFSDMPIAMAELKRVAKPGAMVYLNANAWGWYFHLVFDLGLARMNFALTKTALRMIFRGLKEQKSQRPGQTQMLVTPQYICSLAEASGFKVAQFGPEGSIGHKSVSVEPAYPKRYYGLVGIYEYLLELEKKSGDS